MELKRYVLWSTSLKITEGKEWISTLLKYKEIQYTDKTIILVEPADS